GWVISVNGARVICVNADIQRHGSYRSSGMTTTAPASTIASIVRAMHDEVVQQLELTKRIGHAGESGRAREEIIRRFLRRFVPRGLGIDTGFVVDSAGNISRQIDIVIYRDNYHPILEIGGLKHFLVESVVAVIENKAAVESRETLRDALESVRSVKHLDRSGGGNNYAVMDFHGKGPKQNSDPRYRVWTAIIAEQSLSRESFLAEIGEDMRGHDISLWLDCFVSVNGFVSRYVDEGNALAWHTDSAHALVLTDPSDPNGEKPLVDFALLLAGRLRHAAVIDYSPEHYFPMSRSHRGHVHVKDEDHTHA
ncbi:MAG: DUF6602 domain-containing protein, partial [Chloroflexota bacterium]